MTATVAAAVPTRGTANTIASMYTTPNSAPINCHLGTLNKVASLGDSKKNISRKVITAPMAKVNQALSTTPVWAPSLPLMEDCAANTAPPSNKIAKIMGNIGSLSSYISQSAAKIIASANTR